MATATLFTDVSRVRRTFNPIFPAAVLVLAAALYLLLGKAADLHRSVLAYRVEAYDTEDEKIRFSLAVSPGSSGSVRLVAGARVSPFRDLSVPAACNGSSCSVSTGQTLRIEWDAKPVYETRHGFAGEVSERFVLFDSDSLYLPQGALGPEFSGSVSFELPSREGWRPILPPLDGARGVFNLRSSSIVHGPFVEHSWEEAGAAHRIFDSGGHETLVSRAKGAVSGFAPFRPLDTGGPYTIVLTPLGAGGRPIAGRSWSGGQVFSPAAYAEDRRALELLVHRYAHVFNRYPPTAADMNEGWFIEGWASWVEAERIDPDGRERLRDLYTWYLRVVHGFEQRIADLPLADDRRANPEELEFLHYCKAPLAVEALDRLLREAGSKGVDGLMLHLFALRRSIDLTAEVPAYAPVEFERFRELYIEKSGVLFLLPPKAPSSVSNRNADAVAYLEWLLLERADIPPPGPRREGLFERSDLLSALRDYRNSGLDGIRRDALAPYLERDRTKIEALAERLLSETEARIELLRSNPPNGDPVLRSLLSEPALPVELMVRLSS